MTAETALDRFVNETRALFARESPACFKFHYNNEISEDTSADADATVIAKGCISHSILDYSFLGA